jgi:ADP-ribose pyrophosphatase
MGAVPHKTETIYEARVFRLCRETTVLPNGKTVTLEIIRHPGSSAVVPLLPDGRVAMIRQYRQSTRDYLWEIPAGTRDPGEGFLDCAKRELMEEAGFRANHLEKLTEILPAPGYSDERIQIFLAHDLNPVPQNLDADEVLDVSPLPLKEALDMVRDGRVQDGLTMIGLLFAANRVSH